MIAVREPKQEKPAKLLLLLQQSCYAEAVLTLSLLPLKWTFRVSYHPKVKLSCQSLCLKGSLISVRLLTLEAWFMSI